LRWRFYARFCSLRKLSDRYSSWMQHMTKDILTTKIMKATKSGGFETRPYIFCVPCVLCGYITSFFAHCYTLKFSLLAQIFRWPVALQNGDLLAPRRQERQVRKFNFFAAFAPLREIFRVLVAASLR
jgi:hypothetical protein